MGFIRDCCGSRRALGPQPCLEEHVAQCWLGDASVRMGLEHHGGSALGPPGSPCPQPVPAALQGLGRRVPARGVPADHPPPGLDGTRDPHGSPDSAGWLGEAVAPQAEGHVLADTSSWWESPRNVGGGHMARMACTGEFKHQRGGQG